MHKPLMGFRALACVLALSSLQAVALDFTAGSGAANGCSRPASVQLHAAAVAWLEPAPLSELDEYGGSHYRPRADRNAGFGVGFAELSAGKNGFCIGLLYREEMQGTASRDLLDILHADYTGAPFISGRQYQADYDALELAARGMRVRKVFEFDGESLSTRIGLGASLLGAVHGRRESVNGRLTATSDSYASGSAAWSLAASNLDPQDFNPFVGAGDPQGWGFSTDLHIQAQFRERTELELVVMDAFGQIYWSDMRRSQRVLDNNTIRVDENANRAALINGMDSRIDDQWRIPPKYHLSLSQRVASQLKLLASDDSLQGVHFPSFGAQWGSDQRFAGATFDLRTRAISINARWDFLGISLTSNRWTWQESSALGASVAFARQW